MIRTNSATGDTSSISSSGSSSSSSSSPDIVNNVISLNSIH